VHTKRDRIKGFLLLVFFFLLGFTWLDSVQGLGLGEVRLDGDVLSWLRFLFLFLGLGFFMLATGHRGVVPFAEHCIP
jgi:fatty acid desaturase